MDLVSYQEVKVLWDECLELLKLIREDFRRMREQYSEEIGGNEELQQMLAMIDEEINEQPLLQFTDDILARKATDDPQCPQYVQQGIKVLKKTIEKLQICRQMSRIILEMIENKKTRDQDLLTYYRQICELANKSGRSGQ